MSNKSILVQIFILIFAVGMITQCNAQGKKNDIKVLSTTGASSNKPADEAKVEGNIHDYEIKEKSLEYLQSLEMPEVNLVFEINNSKLELPADVKDILNSHWRAAIKFSYNEHFNKPSSAQEYYDRDIAWSSYCGKTEQELEQLNIEAPNGKRNLSPNEAGDLYAFLNRAAVEVVTKVERLNK